MLPGYKLHSPPDRLCVANRQIHEPRKDSYEPLAWAISCEGKVWVWQLGQPSHFCPLPLVPLQGVGRDLLPGQLRVRMSCCNWIVVPHPTEKHRHSDIQRCLK